MTNLDQNYLENESLLKILDELDEKVVYHNYKIPSETIEIINNRIQTDDISSEVANKLVDGYYSLFVDYKYLLSKKIKDFNKLNNESQRYVIEETLRELMEDDLKFGISISDYRLKFIKIITKASEYSFILEKSHKNKNKREFFLKHSIVKESYYRVTKYADLFDFNIEMYLLNEDIYKIIKKLENTYFEAVEYDIDSEVPQFIKKIVEKRIFEQYLSEEDVNALSCPYKIVEIDYPMNCIVRDFNKLPQDHKFFIVRKIIEKISNKELLISEKTDEYLYLKKYFEEENLNSLEKFVELLSNNHPPKIFRDLNLLDSNIFFKYDEVKNKFNNIRFKPNENIVDLSHINKRISQTDEYLAPIIVEMSKKGLEILESCAGNHPFSNGFHCCNYFSPQESFFIIKREYTEEEKYFLSKFKDFYISYERIEYYDYDIALIASCLPNRDKNSYFDYMKMCILNDEFLNKLYTYIKEAL